MATTPTPMDTLAALQDQLATLQARLTSLRNDAQAQRSRAQQWQQKYDSTARNRKDPNDLVIVQEAHNAAAALDAQAAQVVKDIEAVRQSIAKTEADVTAYNKALANAADKGLVGDAAVKAAEAEVESRKIKRALLITAGVVLVILVATWAFIKTRKNGKP